MATRSTKHAVPLKPISVNAIGVSESLDFPELGDLAERLHFNPSEGRIWLDDRRMILMHAEVFGALRQKMIDAMGFDRARGILTRIGYMAGSRDAELAWKIRGKRSQEEVLAAGPQLHALEGLVKIEPIRNEIDSAKGHCYSEFIWKHSCEGEVHVANYGISTEPGCWMAIGYSSGYMSAIMGKRVLAREVECVALGDPHCRVIARPLEEWPDAEGDIQHFHPAPPPGREAAPEKKPAGASDPGGYPDIDGDKVQQPDGNVIGASAAFHTILHKVRRVASTDATVLLLGESGVGKSMFARELHNSSKRSGKPFVEVNCAAIPEQLMESELFGVERGAYSGAVESRLGRFEIANGGTLFLDEVATLSLTAQGKLLRVLQTGAMEHLGSTKTITVSVRVVAATNENLQKAVKEGRFREDLFYRLNVFPILIMPLRERKDDLPVLLEYNLKKFSKKHERNLSGITPRALQAILKYSWPGNIRELENVIERGVILADEGASLDIRHLFSVDASFEGKDLLGLSGMGSLISQTMSGDDEAVPGEPQADGDLLAWAAGMVKKQSVTLSAVEDAFVKAAVAQANGNISKAASLLGFTRSQLDYRVKKME
jgi:DNA-binding NtrC family response regulator/predicted hydrocarbon binding protein